MAMTFDEFKKLAAERSATHKNERMGQAYFNALYYDSGKPWLADTVRGNYDLDPFHRDEAIPSFLAYLEQDWEPKPPQWVFSPTPSQHRNEAGE